MNVIRQLGKAFEAHRSVNLADSILLNADAGRDTLSKEQLDAVKKIVYCKEFLEDPTHYLTRLMILRGINGSQPSDAARQHIIKKIPDFFPKLSCFDFLRSIAKHLYKEHQKKYEILECLENWFSNDLWRESYFENLNRLDEKELRISLNIFNRAENLLYPINPEDLFKVTRVALVNLQTRQDG